MYNHQQKHKETLDKILLAEAWRNERLINHFRAIVFSVVGVVELIGRSKWGFDNITIMPPLFILWGFSVFLINVTWMRKHFTSFIPTILTALDILVFTIAMYIAFVHAVQVNIPSLPDLERALFGYLVILSINMIRFSWRHSVWSGICISIAYLWLRIASNTLAFSVVTDFIAIGTVVALLIYINKRFRRVTEKLTLDIREIQERRIESLRALVAGITHELNTPLGALSSCIQVANRASEIFSNQITGKEQRVQRAVTSLETATSTSNKSIERITSVINSLQTFARLDEVNVKETSIHESLDTCIELLSEEGGDQIEIIKKYGDTHDIVCYPGQLNQMFMHILKNAKKSIQNEGTITVTTTFENSWVKVTITDTGCGIPQDKLNQIFDPKILPEGKRSRMGLGLPISYGIAQDHGGDINIESTVNQGTTVSIRLPSRNDIKSGK